MKMMFHRHLTFLFFFLLTIPYSASGQGTSGGVPRRPALIRDTDKAEGKEESEAPKPKEYDPHLARESLKVGNFYLKRGNFVGAVERFKDATEYQPNLFEAWESLARAHEKNDNPSQAVEVFREFMKKNPDSPKVVEAEARIARLTRKK
jgi:tetratricopeptide (TPR) repeat protein